ncbi:MAG: MBL fold metallo-hydrolase [Bacteroidales bacterium]|nr:MBL fold metallo-hydrolase [Bacteroidales bacterium]
MDVKRFVFNPQHVNTYVVSDETRECVIIDCGCYDEAEQEQLAEYIRTNNLLPRHLLVTHLHLDHIFGNAFIKRTYGIAPEASKEDEYLLELAHYQTLAFCLDDDKLEVVPVGSHLTDGQEVKFGNSALKVLFTPGHSAGGVSLYAEREGLLFSGDTLMREAVGTHRLPKGNKDALRSSIVNTLFALPDDTQVLPGHGEATTIAHEKEHCPVLTD